MLVDMECAQSGAGGAGGARKEAWIAFRSLAVCGMLVEFSFKLESAISFTELFSFFFLAFSWLTGQGLRSANCRECQLSYPCTPVVIAYLVYFQQSDNSASVDQQSRWACAI